MSCAKVSYPSKKDAVTACNALMSRGTRFEARGRRRRRNRPEFLRAYHCDDCNGWHLTRKRRWNP